MKKMQKHVRRFLAAILTMLLTLASIGLPTRMAYADEKNELTGLSANEIVAQMGFGWNLGNTFDATGGRYDDPYSGETSWGNPRVTREQIAAVRAAGFTTIRIPVTWNNYTLKDGTYRINPAYIARVKEVVTYAYEEGLFIILNVHHESWVNDRDLEKNYEKIGERLAATWYQIAENFAEFDQHLIFEGMNEPRKAGTNLEWGGNQASYEAVNYLNQVFVNAVRMTDKGYNAERCLMVPGYAASSSFSIMNSNTLPTYNGEVAKNLIISVHSYAPYNFCLSDTMKDFNVNDPACVNDINTLFVNLDDLFLSKGIPVVLGETGATAKNNVPAREIWADYMGTKAAAYGVPIVLWDNGSDSNSGGESHAHMNRRTNEWNYPTVINALLGALDKVAWGSARKPAAGAEDPEESTGILGGTIMWENKDGLTSKKTWDNSYIQFGAKETFFSKGGEIALIYEGSSVPKVILDSEQKSAWWIPVDPARTETKDGKQIAYFTYDAMMSAMKNNGVNAPSELRNFSVVATDSNITMYEIEALGGEASVNYVVFGKGYAEGTTLPEEPTFTDMKFLGWYSTKDYQPGTEYTGGAVDKALTVYAKFELMRDLYSQMVKAGLVEGVEPPTEEATEPETEEPTLPETKAEETTEEETTEAVTEEETTEASETEEVTTEAVETAEITTKAPQTEKTEAVTETESSDKEETTNLMPFILAGAAAVIVAAAVVAGVIIGKKKKK